ncbi:MAG: ribonuclease HI [Firmicutes bacterium HGW-Firmicutes-13]|nr:MAG: ribonuclease HI [Firmicutes bacterium HGW-Firmicutes-13]
MKKKEVEIYTDGACSGNPGPGGWAAVLMHGEKKKEISGGAGQTTNQRMEMKAAVEALKALKYSCKVNLYSDSAYLVNAFNQGWLEKWLKNGWITSQKKPVENRNLWEELLILAGKHDINFIKVKGHTDNKYNNRCDELAREEIKKIKNR